MSTAPDAAHVELDGRPIALSSLDKEIFPDPGISKGAMIEYYERIAPVMLPHISGRPLILQRFPDGVDGSGFFQKNTPDHVPDWIARCEIATVTGGSTSYSVIDGVSGLVYLANQGAVTFHTLLAPADAPDRPCEVVFDLDPAGDDLEPVRRAAIAIRDILDDLQLEPRVKSSGSRGLHIVVDVTDDDADFGLTATFARRIAEVVEQQGPFTLEHRKAKRGGRLFLDILRNAPANHVVAPYSLRPLPGAPVAAPLHWDEALDRSFHPRRVTLGNVFRRLGQIDEPWSTTDPPRATITAALDALGVGESD